MRLNRIIQLAAVVFGLVFVSSFIQPARAGSFTPTSSMNTARRRHTATLLPNGKVLVAGGEGIDGNHPHLSSAELYDPVTGTWTNTGSMFYARSFHTAILLPNGKVLVAGGQNDLSVLSSAELYDPASGTWTETGSMTNFFGYSAHMRHTATLLPNGKVLVAGGDDNALQHTRFAELYDPTTEAWTPTGPMNIGRTLHTATLLPDGQVLVAGGIAVQSLASAELYDPVAGTWTNTGAMNFARDDHTATLLTNGQVLVVWGQSTIASYVSLWELYNPASRTWTSSGELQAWANHTATLLANGKVLVAGGGPGGYGSGASLYNPATGAWTDAGQMADGRGEHTATLLTNGKVLVAGGQGGLGWPLLTAELYDDLIPVILTGAARLPSGAFQFSFTNTPGATFTVLATTNLLLPLTEWGESGSVPEVSSGRFQFTDLQATNSAQRFYRVRSP